MKRRPIPRPVAVWKLYAAAELAPYRSPERAELMRQAAAAQRQVEAARELNVITRKAAR